MCKFLSYTHPKGPAFQWLRLSPGLDLHWEGEQSQALGHLLSIVPDVEISEIWNHSFVRCQLWGDSCMHMVSCGVTCMHVANWRVTCVCMASSGVTYVCAWPALGSLMCVHGQLWGHSCVHGQLWGHSFVHMGSCEVTSCFVHWVVLRPP